MKVEVVKPTELLKSVIKSYTIIETPRVLDTAVLPHCGLVLAIQFRGRVKLNRNESMESIPTLVLSGMRKSFRKFHYEANTGSILVNFTETGAHSIFKQPLFELFENMEPLENFLSSTEIKILEEQISTVINNQQRIALIENFLIHKLMHHNPDKLILSAIDKIYNSKGIININQLADSLHIGQDAFEKRFRKIVGSSPKQFSTVVRIKSLISNGPQNKTLTDLAYHYDFYDQSHFIRQFEIFTGQSPKEFFKTPYMW